MTWLFPPAPQPGLPVDGQAAQFPVRRIFCVGRNYAEHAAEMGATVERDQPVYFTKSAHALAAPGPLPYPPGTSDLHHEVELVVALGAPLDPADPMAAVLGYAVGLDMTRRDLQAVAKEKRLPWDTGKDFEGSAIIGPITPAASFTPGAQRISLSVDRAPRQQGQLSDMVWPVPDLLRHLAGLYRLMPGDLVMTGTPAGVGAVMPGEEIEATIDGLGSVRVPVISA